MSWQTTTNDAGVAQFDLDLTVADAT